MIEKAVLADVEQYFQAMCQISVSEVRSDYVRNTRKQIEEANRELMTLERKRSALQEEVIKTITGESAYDPATLNDILHKVEASIGRVQERLTTLSERDGRDAAVQEQQVKRIVSASEAFASASVDQQRNILSTIIHRIDVHVVDGKVDLQIHYAISADEFLGAQEHGINFSV